MKKIGILTYHSGYNYGASLQAYALQTTIEKLGCDVEIINFEKDDFVASREMITRHPRRAKELIKIVTRIPFASSLSKRQKLFDYFTENTLRTTPRYDSEEKVIQNIAKYDCIVCGSDQIWNVSGKDPVSENMLFFLNFEKKQKRVAYAASFGTNVEKSTFRENEYLPWLKKFDCISVRETNAQIYLNSKGIKTEVCLDPTILLDKEEYDVICEERLIKDPYILMFGWNTNNDLIEVAKRASEYYKLPVFNIVPPPRGMFKGIRRKLDVGPKEFLSMIKYADFIVTNSFHGTAFSATYEKPFVSVVTGNPDDRMKSMLDQLGLGHRLCTKEEVDFSKIKADDFLNVKHNKNILRSVSFDYLSRALGDE